MASQKENLKLGIGGGLVLATFYSAWAVIVFLGSGVTESDGISLLEVIGAYYLGGIAGGLVFGLMLPLRRSLLGSLVLGYLAAVPVYFLAILITIPETIEEERVRLIAIVGGTLVCPLTGAVVAAWFWCEDH